MQPEGPIASVSVPGGVPNPITTTTTTVTRSSGSSSSGSTMSQHHPTSSSSQQQPANQQQPQQPQQQPQAAAKPLFTMEQLQAMQRQMMAASAVPMQPPLPLQPPSSSTAATQPQQQQQPYMVLTQLPLAATPFFNYAQAALPQMMQLPQQPPQQQPQPNTSSSQSLPQQQQPLPATSSSSQSLPLPPLNSGLRGQTHHQQQQQQQHTPNNATVPQTSNNNNNKNSTTAANTTATATSTTTTANPLPAAWANWMNPTPLRQGFSPTVTTGTPMTAPAQTQHLLQQLLYNAAAAQQTQPQQPSQSNGSNSHAPATTTTTTTNAAILPSPPALVPNAMQQNRAQNEQNAQRVQQQQQQQQSQQQQQQSIPLVAHHHYQPRSQQQQQQQQQSQTTTNTTALMTLGSQFLQSRVQPVAQKDDSSHHNNVYSESWKTMFDDDNTNHNSNNDSSSNPCDTTANASSSVPTTDGASRQGQKRSLSMTTEDWAPTPWAEMNATSNHTNDTTTTTAAPAHTNTTNDTSAPTQDTAAQNFSNQLRQLQLFQQQHQQQQQQQIIQQQVQLQQQQRIQSQPATPKETMALPSTVMPPSLLTSMLPAQASGSPKLTSAATASNSKRMKPTLQSVSAEGVSSPQQVLERLLTLRGYTFRRVSAEESAYDTVPSALQLASFGTALVKAVHMEDVPRLSRLLGTGLSANPCNQFRDSIVDLVCKRASADIFTCLVEHGCDLRVCDGFGRTPLHHCCWASTVSPSICRTIVQADAQQLFMEDKRGQTPLEYVRPNQAAAWIEFLKTSVAELFPSGGSLPPVVSLKDVRVDGKLPDPPHSLSVALASAISSGELTPEKLEEMDPAVRAQR